MLCVGMSRRVRTEEVRGKHKLQGVLLTLRRGSDLARILIVDDDKSLRTPIRMCLRMIGHQVVEATNGPDAVRLYRQEPIDLVVASIRMSRQGRLETVKDLQESIPGVKTFQVMGQAHLVDSLDPVFFLSA